MSKKIWISLLFVVVFFNGKGYSQTSFYDINSIQKIEIYFSQPDWDYQLDTARYGVDGYLIAAYIQINGIQFDSVGVKYKGNSSYDSTYAKNPIHIELNALINQAYQGITDIKLGNGYADPSVIREVLAYDILKNYMECPRSNFAQLYINGNYIGLYSNDESINKDFCSSRFNSSNKTFIKCNPVVTPGPTTKSNLKHIPLADSSAYFNFYELKSDYGWNDLVALCDTLTNYPSFISNSLDMDRVMWMLAFNSVLVNLDSYTGVFCQNYYLYKDKSERFNPIVWDLNMAFGGFPFIGSGNSSMAGLTVTNMEQLSPTFHESDPYWPLINAVLNDATLKKMYIAHVRTITNENFVSNAYLSTASQLQGLIDTAVLSDNNLFFTYQQFQNGLIADQPFGSYFVPGISNLMSARVSYLQTNPDFSYIPPVISSVAPSTTTPLFNSVVDITAQVTNSNNVYLGFRYKTSDKFDHILMYDDGAHNDGNPGDNVFGATINVSDLKIQYYVFAENVDAGIFSPERAEFEYYSLTATVPLPFPGQITINEFLALNVADTSNESGEFADWIELRNNSSSDVDLFGLYLSDDKTNLNKYSFPQNTVIPANDYRMVWADENNSTPDYIHVNFKLSQNGEGIWLSDGGAIVLDSIIFGPQSIDVSTGRCPNGTGSFVILPLTSFNNDNCSLSNSPSNYGINHELLVFPNPVKNSLSIHLLDVRQGNATIESIVITNPLGQVVFKEEHLVRGECTIDMSFLESGFYLLEVFSNSQKGLYKIVKQ